MAKFGFWERNKKGPTVLPQGTVTHKVACCQNFQPWQHRNLNSYTLNNSKKQAESAKTNILGPLGYPAGPTPNSPPPCHSAPPRSFHRNFEITIPTSSRVKSEQPQTYIQRNMFSRIIYIDYIYSVCSFYQL